MMAENTRTQEENPLLIAALARAAEGRAVHPLFGIVNGYCECSNREQCSTPGKHPRLKNWQERATQDPRTIRLFWSQFPHANIGGAAGEKSSINVLDVDPRNGGDVGLELLEQEHGPLLDTVEVVTGSGGRHLYFRYDGHSLTNTAGLLAPGLDIRSDGGNVVLPGSIHISGRIYEYEATHGPDDVPLAPLPEGLLAKLRARSNGKHTSQSEEEPIPEGGRNDTLFRLACSMRDKSMSGAAILAALLAENAARCRPPLPREEVEKIAASASKYEPGGKVYARYQRYGEASSGFGGSGGASSQESTENVDWPEPEPLPAGLLPVPEMQEIMIPSPLRPWLVDIAERMQCSLSFPVVGAIVALASLVGRNVGIRPKQHDDWLVVPNLWGAVIGRPGIMKTPALTEAVKPLKRLAAKAQTDHDEALKSWEFSKLVLKAQKEDLERKVKEAVKKGIDPEKLRSSLTEEEQEPIPMRYIVNDSTIEKLGVILNQNPRGVLLYRDELTGWLRTLDREGHESDRAFYLESWNGTEPFTYDRITRGTLYIISTCVSILGGIQPGPLNRYLRTALQGGGDDDGLMQRFQLAVYPDDIGEWKNIDRWPDTAARNRAFSLFEKLDTLDPLAVGATTADGEDISCLRFNTQAQGLFNEWRTDLEQKIRSKEQHPVLEAHLSKYRSLMPSLALLFHLLAVVDGQAEGPVSEHAAKIAAAWCDFLEAHARRIYQGVTQHALFSARKLAERIKEGALTNPFTPRQIIHKGWAGLSTFEDIKHAVEILEDLNWLRSERIEPGEKGGRPRFHYHVNPRLREGEPAA